MKKMIIAAALALPMSVANAGNSDTGCGLGTMLWEGKLNNWGVKIFAATTNGIFANQLFGITSGTLGCSSRGSLLGDARLMDYASSSFDQIAVDAARGEGESLGALAALWGVAAEDQDEFAALVQGQYAAIFSGESMDSAQMLLNLNAALSQSEQLAQYARAA